MPPFLLLRATLAALLTLPLATLAQPSYPARAITLVVPFAPGGGTDSIARDIAKNLGERLGQPVVVDNRGGAGGAIGAAAVAKAPADGYTLLFATSTFITNAAVEAKLPYDPLKDFAPVAMIGRGPLLLVASRQVGATSVAQLVAAARAQPQGLNYCSAGNGSINHLAGEMFRQRAGLELTHVPFKGSGPATVELLAGRVDLFFATVPTILAQVREGKLPLLAVTSARRSPLFPDTPTVAEAGLPGFEVGTWWGVLAPGKTPKAIVDALNRAVNEAAAAEPMPGRLEHEGASAVRLTPAAFGEELRKELALWRGIAAKSGLQHK
ncbi:MULTISPECIES: tripartite tricarboxylate transporter substrate binding protein [Delftia]|jgi:tripartite-type tricarboxylate transporter receptor subunit TctC|uniref:tripartite tricarboxylate transporter substrate binding protein n=1 Tax=Delftia TaxID=80865 RepID=UPI0007AE99D0|nr:MULTISPECIES: tripartite tricarboxylate transporter substrate binding protein [Delftia]KZK25959.1 Fis family transcriptional regulator [Delftia sp. GW456-R20]MBD9584104.1 tripartite tricarboxylate transporter substrate binding protein [Delftia sp. DLF01]MBK0115659.1 tripartite tricarboxylate transporter substrate binding protein [Delftia sp. S65]MBK0121476.1 tripartite tricarboxylate transporter substrate binding protein [Delftia sp. S67]MBK0133339.1 tripartite tricarboxylate transporter su